MTRAHIPNLLSYTRLLITGVIGALFLIPHAFLFAQVLMVLGIVSDKLDGTLARRWKVESERGKQLESVIDPLFLFVTMFYLVRFGGFPAQIFWIGAVFAFIGTIARILTSMKAKRPFYEKSPITRIGVGVGYVLVLCYILQLPYREYLLWPAVIYAGIILINYLRMMLLFVRQRSATVYSD